MKIIIASGIYPPDIGGPATYSQMIAREFSKRRHEVAVICYSDSKSVEMNEMDEMVEVVRILRKYPRLIRYWLYFWNLLKLAKNTDVIYAQGPLAAGLPATRVSKILKKKLVVKIVGDYAWEQYQNKLKIKSPASSAGRRQLKVDDIETFQNKKYDFWTELRRKIQKFVCKKADKIIVPSEFLKKIVRGWRVSNDKIEVIYNAFAKINNVRHPMSSYYDNVRTSDVIISAGRPEPWKGFDTLKEIMPDLIKENPNFKLIIATKLSHDELMGYFRRAKMFVLNSGYEGFPHIVLEAMACGLPVITTNVCGNPEIIKDGYNGLLIEYNNKKQLKEAILKLWKDKKLQKKFIENGKKVLERFKLETMIKKTLKALKT